MNCNHRSFHLLLIGTWMLGCLVAPPLLAEERSRAGENEQIVREFIAAWSRLDAEELASYFTEDGVYYNMPTSPITGRENVRSFIAGFTRSWEKTEWEILNLLSEGNLVLVERVDRTVVAGRDIALPCFGVFEMKNGKIHVWRDYFDLATFTDAIAPPED